MQWHEQPQQASTPLPAGFVTDAAVLCVPRVRDVHGRGHLVFTKRVAHRGLAALVTALRRPVLPASPGEVCATDFVIPPLLFLIDPGGQVVRPMLPADACGHPAQPVLNALHHVPWEPARASARP